MCEDSISCSSGFTPWICSTCREAVTFLSKLSSNKHFRVNNRPIINTAGFCFFPSSSEFSAQHLNAMWSRHLHAISASPWSERTSGMNCRRCWSGRETPLLPTPPPSELGALHAARCIDLMNSGFWGAVLKCSNKNTSSWKVLCMWHSLRRWITSLLWFTSYGGHPRGPTVEALTEQNCWVGLFWTLPSCFQPFH